MMTAKQIQQLREVLGDTWAEFAARFNPPVSERTAEGWGQGRPVHQFYVPQLEALARRHLKAVSAK